MGLALEVSTVLRVQCTNLIVCRWSHDQSETEYGALKFGGEKGRGGVLDGKGRGWFFWLWNEGYMVTV